MKKLLNLQLFAEETATSTTATAEGAAAQEKATDTKEPETAQKTDETGEKKYTDKDVDKIVGQKKAEWAKQMKKELEAEKAKAEEAQKLATMNATQKAEYERDQIQKKYDELLKKDTLSEMSKEARKMLSAEGINISDDLLSLMVTTDAEETKAAIDGFTKMYKEAVESGVKEKLKGTPPKKSSGVATMTKEQIMSIKDPELRQQKMLEHKELFNF